jgi:hypothetical protein
MSARLRVWRSAVAAVGLAAVATITGGQLANAAGSGVPYSDPNALGSISLCDKAGNAITSGSLATTPFVWRAVSSQGALAPYNGSGRTATLYAFQPRSGLAPGDWSGEAMTAAGRYTNSFHPMTAATRDDASLGNFVKDFPPLWDGLVQLRVYLGVPGSPTFTLHYPAADIQVTGNTWHVVNGGNVSCHSGTSVSVAAKLLPPPSPKAHASGQPKSYGSAHPGGAGTNASDGPTASAGAGAGSQPTTSSAAETSGPSTGSNPITVLAILLGALVVLGVVAYLFSRRRRPPPSSGSPLSPVSSSSTKGR